VKKSNKVGSKNIKAPQTKIIESKDDSGERTKKQGAKSSVSNPKSKTNAALELANKRCELALAAPTKARRVQIAKEALAISDECWDAYNILTDVGNHGHGACAYMLQMAQVIARILKRDFAHIPAKDYWKNEETSACLEHMFVLAETLETLADAKRSTEAYDLLLSLNLSDDRGINEIIGSLYYEIGRDRDLDAWLKKWEGQKSAWYVYTKALYSYRKTGRSRKAKTALLEAFARNPYVVQALFELVQLPETVPENFVIGELSEAAAYLMTKGFLWHDTIGARPWAEEVISDYIGRKDGDMDLFDEIAGELRKEFGFENDGPDLNKFSAASTAPDTAEADLFQFNLSDDDLADLSDILTGTPASKKQSKDNKKVVAMPATKGTVSKSKAAVNSPTVVTGKEAKPVAKPTVKVAAKKIQTVVKPVAKAAAKKIETAVKPAAKVAAKKIKTAVKPVIKAAAKKTKAVKAAARAVSKKVEAAVKSAAKAVTQKVKTAVKPATKAVTKKIKTVVKPIKAAATKVKVAVKPVIKAVTKKIKSAVKPTAKVPEKKTKLAVKPATKAVSKKIITAVKPIKAAAKKVKPALKAVAKKVKAVVKPSAKAAVKKIKSSVKPVTKAAPKKTKPTAKPVTKAAKKAKPAGKPATKVAKKAKSTAKPVNKVAKKAKPAGKPATKAAAKAKPASKPAKKAKPAVKLSAKKSKPATKPAKSNKKGAGRKTSK